MTAPAKVLRYTAFTLMVLFGLVGTLFVAGYAFEDLGGWLAAGLTAMWALPMVGFSIFALLRPAPASQVLVGLTVIVALFTLVDSAFGVIPRDDWGPVAAVAVLALGVALAFLGIHRAALAGLLLVTLALAQLAATAIGIAVGGGEGPGLRGMLGTSSGVVVVPMLVIGVLFLLAGQLDHEPLQPGVTPRSRPVH